MMARKKRWVSGSVVEIPLPDGTHTYGLLRNEPLISVFDVKTVEALEPERVVQRPVLFAVWVMARALALWPVVGVVPLSPAMERPESFVKRDRISGRVSVYTEGRERPAELGELEKLEVAAVWEPEHVVDRVVDHYAGKPNKWAESLRNLVVFGDGKVGPR
jgi:hypothetical protein